MKTRGVAILALGAALVLGGAAAAAEPKRPPPLEETAGVVSVQVPVQVFKDGTPVRGLTADDFELYDGKEQHPISAFEILDSDAPLPPAPPPVAEAAAPPAPPPRRKILLLFDLSTSQIAAFAKAREIAEKYVVPSAKPQDLIAVAAYTSRRGAKLVLGFTSDRRQLQTAFANLAVGVVDATSRDPLGLTVLHAEATGSPEEPSGLETGTLKATVPEDDRLVTETTQIALLGSRNLERQSQLDRVTSFSSDLKSLARALGAVSGRKQVIFFSQGFDVSMLYGAVDRAEIEQMSADLATGDVWRVDGQRRFANNTVLASLDAMIEEFRKSDASVEVVDTGSLRSDNELRPRAKSDDTLSFIAHSTGGEVSQATSSVQDSVNRMLERSSVTYVLWFEPRGLKEDGAVHKLTVKLRNPEKGIRIYSRPSYTAPKAGAEQDDTERRLEAASLIVGDRDAGDIRLSVLAAPFASTGDGAFVTVILEAEGSGLLRGHSGAALPVDVYVYAFDSQGTIRDFFSQRMSIDLRKLGEMLGKTGLRYFGALRLPPGAYTLRALVQNSRTGRSGFRVTSLEVPAIPGNGLVLLPPFVSQPARRWVVARSPGRAGESSAEPYPFQFGRETFVPSARLVFDVDDRAKIGLVAYNLGGAPSVVRIRLVDETGADVPGVAFDPLERNEGAGGAAQRLVTTLRASGVPPGKYTISVMLKNTLTGETASVSAPVVVTPGEARRDG